MWCNSGFAEKCIKGNCINGQGTAKWTGTSSCLTCEIEYVGEWKDGYQHGQGIETNWDGSKYVGEWKNGSKHGQGVETYQDGSKYVGEFIGGYYEGIGTAFYLNGDKYEGEWSSGNRHGQGTLTKADGKKIQGNWNNGNFFEKPKIVKKEVVNQQGLQETFLSESKEIKVLDYLNFTKVSKRYIEMFPVQLDSKKIKLDLELYPWSSKYNIKQYFDHQVLSSKNDHEKNKLAQEQFYELFLFKMHKVAYNWDDKPDTLVPNNLTAHAQTILGLLYKNGELVDQNFERAFKLFEFAAGKRSAIAMYNLGMMYKEGQFVEQDNEIAFMWLDIAYREGKFPSFYDLKNEDRENMKVALLEIMPLLTQEKEKKKLVQKEEEKLTEKKAAEAKKLTEKKAAEEKKLTEEKAAEEKKLLLLSPKKKLEIAQQFLENVKTFVKLYPDEFDTIKIFEFILATRSITEGTLDDKLKEDLKLFIEFTNKSKQFVKYQDEIEKNIKNGLSHKKAVVAVKKEEKKEVIKKEEKKEEKIDKSDLKKITTLGYQYFDGSNGFKKDIKKSAELWKLAAEQGYAEAQYQLGISYKYGEGVKKDLAIAYMWISNSLMELYRINSKSGLKDSHRKKENMLSNDKNLLNDDRMVNEAINQLDDLYASMPSSDLIKGINLGNSCWKSKFKNCDK